MRTNASFSDLWCNLHDPDYDLMSDCFQIVSDVEFCYKNAEPGNQKVLDLAQQMLLRLRCNYPHVFVITVGQFPYFSGIEEFWEKNGFRDSYGFLWLMPETFGPYNMNK